MKCLTNFLRMDFNDLEFEGLRFSSIDKESSFKSIKERNDYLNTLINEGSEFSSLRYQSIFKEFQKSEIHVKLSFSIMFKIIAYILMGLAFIATVNAGIIGLAVMGLGVILYFINFVYRRMAKDLYIGFLAGPSMIDFMFEQNREFSKTK